MGNSGLIWITCANLSGQRYSSAGSLSYELAVLVGHVHLGDANTPAAFYHPAFGNKLIVFPGRGDEMDIELRCHVGSDDRVSRIGKSLVGNSANNAAENHPVEIHIFRAHLHGDPGVPV